MKRHRPPSSMYPERAARLDGVESALSKYELWDKCVGKKVTRALPREAFVAEYGAKVVRSWEYGVARAGNRGSPVVDERCGDIYWSEGSLEAVGIAAGAAVEAVETVLDAKDVTHAFAIVRPPGHHCFDVPEGFCIANNVVLAVRTAMALGKRVAVLDWDYHYGDGTARALMKDEAATFCSVHCARNRTGGITYPVDRYKGDELAKKTDGRLFNIQWDCDDADDAAICYAMTQVIVPAFARHRPDIILISAGYDAIKGDDLAGMELSPHVFEYLTIALRGLGVPVVAVLEGGYNPYLLGEGVAATLKGMLSTNRRKSDMCAKTATDVKAQHKEVVDAVHGYLRL
jgi:acetoin utilization deacetylase AcuC-like enzyme